MINLYSRRLVLEPLTAAHAEAMFGVLSEEAIYRHLDYPPPCSLAELCAIYRRWEARQSPDGTQQWLNWVVRPSHDAPIGFVQATVGPPATASIAYIFGSEHGGRGFATEAVAAMLAHLADAYGVLRCLATVEAANEPSIRLLARVGFRAALPEESREHGLTRTERLFVRVVPGQAV